MVIKLVEMLIFIIKQVNTPIDQSHSELLLNTDDTDFEQAQWLN